MLAKTTIFAAFCVCITLPSPFLIKGIKPLICGLNEVPTKCVEPCLPTCETPQAPPCTFRLCLGGCACSEGYIRKYLRGPCVKIDSCVNPDKVSRNKTVPECTQNEMFSECASNCQPTCDRRDVSECTKLYCAHGCVCKDGYVRKEITGICVPVNKCS